MVVSDEGCIFETEVCSKGRGLGDCTFSTTVRGLVVCSLILLAVNGRFLLQWFQIGKLQQVAKELEDRLRDIADDMKKREAETEKLRQALSNTPQSDPAYVGEVIT